MLPLLALPSCESEKEVSLNGYEITFVETISEMKLYQTGVAYSTKALISNVGPDWWWSGCPVLFTAECNMSSKEISLFADKYNYSNDIQDTKYKCDGVNLYSYSRKVVTTPGKYNLKAPEDAVIVAPYYIADVDHYTVKSIQADVTFDVYGAKYSPYLGLANYRS